MRQITEQAVNAFYNWEKFNKQNMRIEPIESGGAKMYLHDNLIASIGPMGLYISNAGWATNTTKERLNALTGVSIYQKDFEWFLNGKPWNGKLIEIK